MLASISHILPLTTVVRKRLLPADGRVVVRVGQKVDASDVVADAFMGRKHLILDVAFGLRVSPRDAVAMIKVKKSQRVSQNDVIAKSSGLFAREVKAPVDGRVVAMGGGKIVLETGGSNFELLAGLPGVVSEVIGDRGVVIRSTGGVIQGLWGNGRLDTGVMMSIVDHPEDGFDVNRLDVTIRSSIILGGYVDNPAVFKNAGDLPVKGLILSSMSPALLPLANQLSYPIVLLDGFGRRPFNSSAYKLLSTNLRREVTLNATSCNRFSGDRPEIFIPLPVSQDPPEPRDLDVFAAGQTVRVISLTRPARIGTLRQIVPNLVTLPNGLKCKTAEVRLESGEQFVVPLTNLEVLG